MAGIVEVDGSQLVYNDELSVKNFMGWEFLSRPKYDFNNKVVYASNFSQEIPGTQVFPDNLRGTTFVNCNLDNVAIPAGAIVFGGSRRRFKAQNDMRDWEVGVDEKPAKLLDEEYWFKAGYSIDKAEIPKTRIRGFEDIPKATPQ